MAGVRIQRAAAMRLDEIWRYADDRWGGAQADAYIRGLFEAFERIGRPGDRSRPVPAEFGVEGFVFRHEKHFVYWRWLSDGTVGIVTVLHERMHQTERFRDDTGLDDPKPS